MAQRYAPRQPSLWLLVTCTLLSIAVSPAALSAQTGLVAAWGFNEGSGTSVADATGNNNTGTITGATWSTLGRYGNALSFNGTTNVVVVNSAATLNLTTGMTLSAWVFPTATQSGWRTVMERAVDAYFLHASSSSGSLRPAAGGTFNGTGKNFAAPSAIAANTWTHLAVTYDGAALRLFVNGTQVATTPQTGAIAGSTNPLYIGGNSPYGEYFQGRIDEVRVYNRPLSATEIQSDMAVGVGGGGPDVTVPTVAITAPTANPTLTVTTTPLTLGGTAGDNVGVTQVSWTNDRGGSGVATGTTAWSAANVALVTGDNVLTVTARDAAGNIATDVLTVTYAPDVTVPTVAITAPTASPTFTVMTTPLAMGGTAGDNVGVTQVSWTNDRGGSGVATGTTAWSVANVALLTGDNILTVTARDAAGNVATDVLTVTYAPDVTLPTVAITAPTANPTLAVTTTPLALGGTAGDNVGVTQVSWTNNRGGSGLATGTTAWSVASIALLSGDNVLTVTARDAAGNVATDVLTVTYTPSDVIGPTVAITTPTANPTLTVTTTPLTIGGTAGDNVGVTQVSWTNDRGGSGVASGTAAWSVANIALLAGDNILTVTARDAAGNVATDVLTVTYTSSGPPPGLVAAWGFNEGSGTSVADASGNNLTGTITGATWSTLGRYGSALTFNGTNNVVVVNSAAVLNLTTGMTLSAWVFPTATQAGWRTVVERELDAYFLHASSQNGNLRPAAGGKFNGTDKNFASPSSIAANVWTHLAVTYDGAALRLFVNGTQVAASPQTGAIASSTNPLYIGGNSPWGEYFLGRIDDVRIYNRPLTVTEIQSDMAVSVGGGGPDVTVPTVTITTPTANPTLAVTTTPLTIGGTAGDNVGVTQVSWTNDRGGSGVATGTTAWSVANIALLTGDNVLTVTARDAAGNVATDVLTATYTPDVTLPTVAITTPTANPTLTVTTTPLSIGGTAGDNVGVTQVSWTNDRGGSGVATGTTGWSIANIALLAGDNVLTVTARDAAGNVATDVLTVTYAPSDVTIPTVTITTPTGNPTLTVTTTPLSVGGTAGDNVGVTQVSWTTDRGGSGVASGTTAWSIANIALLTGDNVLTVTARDAAGNVATDVLTVTYAPAGPPSGLVAAWGFNEGAGTIVADATGNNNTGTITGATWSTQGRYGNALDFNGSSNLVVVNSVPALNLTSGMTLSAWVYPTANESGWRTVMERAVDAYFLHASGQTGTLRPAAGGTFNGTGANFAAPNSIAANTWTHLAVTYDDVTLRLFVNGTQVATTPRTGAISSSTSPLYIGGNVPYGEFFQGRLDDVRIYNRPLSATEIQSDMAVSLPAAPRLVLLQPTLGGVITSTTVPVSYTTAGDLTEVNHVHFQLDANPEVMDLTLDGVFQFTNVLVGSHVLHGYLVRVDHSKILDTDAYVSFTTTAVDPTPPTVAITAPASGATVTGTITMTAAASDNSGLVAGVQFFLDGVPLEAEITSAPFSAPWNTVTATNGSHNLTARARDASGNAAVSAAVAVTVSNTTSSNPAVVGLWSQVLDWPLVPIHMNLMPNGKVLVWDDHTDATGADVFDPLTLSITPVPFTTANLFCAGHGLLPDGRVMVIGGHSSNHVGITNTSIFNGQTQSWSSGARMAVGRWYPTLTALPNGRMLALAGEVDGDERNALIPEVYDPAANTWTRLPNAPLDLPYYPHPFVLPDGRILVAGSNRREIPTYTLDVNSQTWTVVDPAALHGGSSVMYLPGKVMKSGRARDPDLVGVPSVTNTYVIDMTAPTPRWRATAPMAFPRTEHNLTLLADGTVLTIGGGLNSDVFDPNAPVLTPELWDPVGETWSLMAPTTRPRIYHSTAVLLPDGRVLSGGGGRWGPSYLEAQFYSPPYLFKGPRPTITSAPATLGYGVDFFVGTAATNISAVTLVRIGAVTHAFHTDERFLKLTFQPTTGGYTVQSPANANLAPPGHYMLFILDANGVPAVAPIVKVQ